MLRLKQI